MAAEDLDSSGLEVVGGLGGGGEAGEGEGGEGEEELHFGWWLLLGLRCGGRSEVRVA